MQRPVKIAVVGCGVIGTAHLDRLAKDDRVFLSAICDTNEATLQRAEKAYRPNQVFFSTDELIEKGDFDAAILALPTLQRHVLTQNLIKRKKHLLLEKPVGFSEVDINNFASEVKEGQVIASCSSRWSNSSALRQGRAWIEEGRIGEVRAINCRVLLAAKPVKDTPPPTWRIRREINGGGILSNWGAYDLDFLMALTGWSFIPARTCGHIFGISPEAGGFYVPQSNVETHAVGIVEDISGKLLHYERAEFYPGESSSLWEVLGTKGSIRINMLYPDDGVKLYQLHEGRGIEVDCASFPEDADLDIHGVPCRNFISAILGEEKILTDLPKSALIARIVDGIYASSIGESVST